MLGCCPSNASQGKITAINASAGHRRAGVEGTDQWGSCLDSSPSLAAGKKGEVMP
jgi:hypothetical protein